MKKLSQKIYTTFKKVFTFIKKLMYSYIQVKEIQFEYKHFSYVELVYQTLAQY